MDIQNHRSLRADAISLAMVLVLILSLSLTVTGRFLERCDQIRDDTLRLHILANSDSEADQQHKLAVRDALLAQYSTLLASAQSEEAAARLAEFMLDDIVITAEKTLRSLGDESAVKAEITRMYFDTRRYDDGLTLPAGEYTALRILIGEGSGENWWCVMYPPLCIPAATAGEAEDIEHRIESLSDSPGYEARFALVEWVQKQKNRAVASCNSPVFVLMD